jgi:hypothetical protein
MIVKKYVFSHGFVAFYFLKVHLHQASKIKSKKSKNIVGMVFLTFLLVDGRIRIRI